jgi:hypothetical protein
MGTAFSIDSPIKVAHYGIDSVMSIVDDDLVEKVRKIYCDRTNRPFTAIFANEEDSRAKRITAYLNLVNEIVAENFRELKNSYGTNAGEFEKFIDLLPEDSELKSEYIYAKENGDLLRIKDWIFAQLIPGSIDVNIMTKVDKANYKKGEKLPVKFNDAHASLRGFANSNLKSSVVLSAGMNPRLYSYFENFEDFYPDENGELKKKIILKVSDYRSALIQGKFMAKKGLWISEYRIESGLNCGGHAFATEGYLMGPILEEFKIHREDLIKVTHEIYKAALERKNIRFNGEPHEIKVTAQGGVGTQEEQNFLLDNYNVDSVGWGTPFLLVPEVTNVDEDTLKLLSGANEDDLYLSKISPLGVPFNSIKGNSKDIEKFESALNGRPGSPCPKKFLQSNTEFSDKPICTASRTFQEKKIKELEEQDLDREEFLDEYEKIIEKACLCVGLSAAILNKKNVALKVDGKTVSICPGPNMAYFSSVVSLKEMVDHIYGRTNLITKTDRPNMFIKELKLYINFLKDKITDVKGELTDNQRRYFITFGKNMIEGINYYKNLFDDKNNQFKKDRSVILDSLRLHEVELINLTTEIENLTLIPRTSAVWAN